jgi:uncharacterized UPF0160 family protein
MKGKNAVYLRLGEKTIKKVTNIDNGFLVGNIDKKELVLSLIGEPNFDETMDDMMSAIYHIMSMADEQTNGKDKEEIYTRTVQAFSLIVDKFSPEMANKKFGDGVTDEAILKAQEDVVNVRSKQKES